MANLTKVLIILLVTATQFEEKQCATAIDVVAENVTVVENPRGLNTNDTRMEGYYPAIWEHEPLLKQVRRNIDQTTSHETQNLAEVLQNIYKNDPELLHQDTEESDGENKSSFQDFQNVLQDLIESFASDIKRGKQRQYKQSLSRQIAGKENLQSLYKTIPKHIYYNSNEQYPKHDYYNQKIQKQNKYKTPVYNDFMQLYRLFNDRNDEDEFQRVASSDDYIQNHHDEHKTRSKVKVYYIPIVPKSGAEKVFKDEDMVADDDKDISMEQQGLRNKQRQKRSPTIVEFPHPERTEGGLMNKESDPDVYYEHPDKWPYPANGQFDIDDPRNPKHPLYGQLWKAKFVPQKFINDDYQPFLGIESDPYEHDHPCALFGQKIFLSQAVPLLKSMIFGTGIEQGPKDSPFRVHWADLKHYKNISIPPLPFPRPIVSRKMNNIYVKVPTHNDDENIDLAKHKVDLLEAERVIKFKKSNSKADGKVQNKSNNTKINKQEKHVPKKLSWWPRNGKSKSKKKLFKLDKNKNYTVVLKVS